MGQAKRNPFIFLYPLPRLNRGKEMNAKNGV
jgi:hypothetical protein